MSLPFGHINALMLPDEEIASLRVDRRDELQACLTALFDRTTNVFIHGPRGVGKSFFVRLLRQDIRQMHKEVLPLFLNMTGLLHYGAQGAVSAFPTADRPANPLPGARPGQLRCPPIAPFLVSRDLRAGPQAGVSQALEALARQVRQAHNRDPR